MEGGVGREQETGSYLPSFPSNPNVEKVGGIPCLDSAMGSGVAPWGSEARLGLEMGRGPVGIRQNL